MTRLESVFQLSLPSSVAALLRSLDFFSFSIGSFGLPLECLQLGSFYNLLLVTTFAPYALYALILVCCAAVSCKERAKRGGFLRASGMRALPYLMGLSFLTFPMVTSLAFQAFACEDFDDGSSHLKARRSVRLTSHFSLSTLTSHVYVLLLTSRRPPTSSTATTPPSTAA